MESQRTLCQGSRFSRTSCPFASKINIALPVGGSSNAVLQTDTRFPMKIPFSLSVIATFDESVECLNFPISCEAPGRTRLPEHEVGKPLDRVTLVAADIVDLP